MRWEGGTRPGPHYIQRIAEVTGEPESTFSDDDEEADMSADLLMAVRQLARVLAGAST